jgi:hypothetical protein
MTERITANAELALTGQTDTGSVLPSFAFIKIKEGKTIPVTGRGGP